MNTHTILNIKTDKVLKAEAKEVADQLGVPLSTVINAFLKQFVREKSITLSTGAYRPTPYLIEAIREAETEMVAGKVKRFTSVESFLKDLKK